MRDSPGWSALFLEYVTPRKKSKSAWNSFPTCVLLKVHPNVQEQISRFRQEDFAKPLQRALRSVSCKLILTHFMLVSSQETRSPEQKTKEVVESLCRISESATWKTLFSTLTEHGNQQVADKVRGDIASIAMAEQIEEGSEWSTSPRMQPNFFLCWSLINALPVYKKDISQKFDQSPQRLFGSSSFAKRKTKDTREHDSAQTTAQLGENRATVADPSPATRAREGTTAGSEQKCLLGKTTFPVCDLILASLYLFISVSGLVFGTHIVLQFDFRFKEMKMLP